MSAAERFRRFAILVLGATLAVILWGAFVRATGSGAGCGSHWPSCNGTVIPRAPETATLIEFTHRFTSGIAFLLVVVLAIWARRVFPKGHAARRAAALSLFFMVTEALIGAGLVLFEMVALNRSLARGAWMAAHLMNTFVLLAAMGLTVFHARENRPTMARAPRSHRILVYLGLAVTMVVAVSGAVAALGDTLFPASSLAEGIRQDLSPTAHLFVRLRVLHPVLAIAGGLYLIACAIVVANDMRRPGARARATMLGVLVLVQLAAGIVNLLLLAPIPMQLIHLLLADLLWLTLVALCAEMLRHDGATTAPAQAG